jgi:hypothetical protein
MNSLQTHYSHLAAPAVCDLNATGVKLRIPVTDNLTACEFGFRVVSATASGTAIVVKIQGEPISGGAAVDLLDPHGQRHRGAGQERRAPL